MNFQLAVSILKYNPIETLQSIHYPTSDQNRLNTGKTIQTKDTFDYTTEQRRKAENYILNYLYDFKKKRDDELALHPDENKFLMREFHVNFSRVAEEHVRHLVERQVGSQDFQTKLQSLFFEFVGL